ncbi:SCO family protein [Pseudomonas paeninsulae]|uniref:SCO family protein n=1 Tax=Pseudomonas paeninsulae TaxID=3110772 RepID=UPI002D789016|nr:SCO family protein [Pseudomonas sp. IT1137]
MNSVKRLRLALPGALLSAVLLLTPGVMPWAQEAPVNAALASVPADSLYGLAMPLTDAQGEHFDWREMAGKPLLVTMFYGDCASACPVLMQSLQRTIAELQPEEGALKVLMVSLNPQHDTPASLAHMSHTHQLDERFFRLAVAADEGQTRAMAAVLKIKYRALDNGEISHNTRVSLLSASGQVIASSTVLKPVADQALLSEIRQALQ